VVGLVILAVQVLITGTICLVVVIRRNRRNNGGDGGAGREYNKALPEQHIIGGGFDAPSIASSNSEKASVSRNPEPGDVTRNSYLEAADVDRLRQPDTEIESVSENMNFNNKKSRKKSKKRLKEKDIRAFARAGSNSGHDGPQGPNDPDLLPFDKSKLEDDAQDMYMY